MGKKRFFVRFVGSAVIELDDDAIDAVDDEWRSRFYDLYTPADIAAHIAYNLHVNHARLGMLDGWADQPDENARIVEDHDWDCLAYIDKAELCEHCGADHNPLTCPDHR